ncbi:hypothetical protein, conserved [Angomonas deanei]|uniref:Uncharacterized protein n=1 Tax=Angomonas deanei TaxID=59799 RepID=A0A7G2C2Z9_9TRYP|nr:hypothetical protein, conserved [Angomonas deanei]
MFATRGNVSLPRQIGRVCTAVIGVHMFMGASCILYSLLCRDQFEEAQWACSTPVFLKRPTWRFWDPLFFRPFLSGVEQKCVESWMNIMSLDPPELSQYVSSRLITQDTVVFLDGLHELRDGTEFLKLFIKNTPYVKDIRRQALRDVTFIHVKVNSTVTTLVPFTERELFSFNFPSTAVLQIEQVRNGNLVSQKLTGAEHRWFNGPALSRQTASCQNVLGDAGDLCRRYTGFLMWTMLTKTTTIDQVAGRTVKNAAQFAKELRALEDTRDEVEIDHDLHAIR